MSIMVTLPQLAETLARYRFAYLLTIGDDARAHVVAVSPTLVNDSLVVTVLGQRTRANLAAHPELTLVWPPANPRDYSLIVDGVGSMRDDELAVTPTRAVLHRPAPPETPATGDGAIGDGCDSDCVELPMIFWWIGDLILLFVVLPIVIVLMKRIIMPVDQIRAAVDDILRDGVILTGRLDDVPELLNVTDNAVKEICAGATSYVTRVGRLLEALNV